MPRSRHLLVPLLLPSAFILLPSIASADVLTLGDGTRFEGKLSRDGEDWLVTTAGGVVHRAHAADVKSIDVTGTRTTPDDRLASLRRAVENLPDIPAILARYQQFIAQNPGTGPGVEAARDVAAWRERQARGYVRVAGRWLAPGDARAVVMKANDAAARARILVKDGNVKDADGLLTEALGTDPNCAAALYLRGLILVQQNQLAPARKALEQLADLVPDHAPTLNNLAVTLYRQGQYPAALTDYDQAMLARPDNLYILANVAEALNSLPQDVRNSVPARRAAQHLQQQQLAVDPVMATQGYHRWGSTYVPEDEYRQLQATEQQNQARAAQLQADYNSTAARIDQIDRTLADNDRTLRLLEAQSRVIDTDGNLTQLPLPVGYYTLQGDQTRLSGERAQLAQRLTAIRAAAQQPVQDPRAVPKYTNQQHPIGPEGTPLVIPGIPTTAPAR